MKTRYKRLLLIMTALALLGLGTTIVLATFQRNLVFFYTPTQVVSGSVPGNHAFRVGGMVEKNSLQRLPDGFAFSFDITDTVRHVHVIYHGLLPDLFKEGKGVVAQGKLAGDGVFMADEVLAKHDENYMPPDAAYAVTAGQHSHAGAAAGQVNSETSN